MTATRGRTSSSEVPARHERRRRAAEGSGLRARRRRLGERVRSEDLALSVLVVGEIRHGIEIVRRRGDAAQAEIFAAWLTRLKAEFSDRLIPLSHEIVERWGELRGRVSIAPVDALMAATALEHGLTFVTRDLAVLRDTGVRLLNPWNR